MRCIRPFSWPMQRIFQLRAAWARTRPILMGASGATRKIVPGFQPFTLFLAAAHASGLFLCRHLRRRETILRLLPPD